MDSERAQIIKSTQTFREMFKDRSISIDELEKLSDIELSSRIAEASNWTPTLHVKVNADTSLFYYMRHKFQKKRMETVSRECLERRHVVFVFKEKINNHNEKIIKEIFDDAISDGSLRDDFKYEVFCIKDLLFNITKHKYVPKHELVSEDEHRQIKEAYCIKNNSQFPIILAKSDPVARYYDFQPGQLIKIYRTSTSTGHSISYRFCV